LNDRHHRRSRPLTRALSKTLRNVFTFDGWCLMFSFHSDDARDLSTNTLVFEKRPPVNIIAITRDRTISKRSPWNSHWNSVRLVVSSPCRSCTVQTFSSKMHRSRNDETPRGTRDFHVTVRLARPSSSYTFFITACMIVVK